MLRSSRDVQGLSGSAPRIEGRKTGGRASITEGGAEGNSPAEKGKGGKSATGRRN